MTWFSQNTSEITGTSPYHDNQVFSLYRGYITGTSPVYTVGTRESLVHCQTMTSILPILWVQGLKQKKTHTHTHTKQTNTHWLGSVKIPGNHTGISPYHDIQLFSLHGENIEGTSLVLCQSTLWVPRNHMYITIPWHPIILPTQREHWGYITGTLPIYNVGTSSNHDKYSSYTVGTSDSQVHHQTMTSILPTLWIPVLQVCHQTMTSILPTLWVPRNHRYIAKLWQLSLHCGYEEITRTFPNHDKYSPYTVGTSESHVHFQTMTSILPTLWVQGNHRYITKPWQLSLHCGYQYYRYVGTGEMSLPWCHLKMTNKSAKWFETFKPFCFSHWHVKGFSSKCIALKADVLSNRNALFLSDFHISVGLEILQAGAVKG